MNQKSNEHEGNKLLTNKQLDKKLDSIIEPLLSKFPVALKPHELDKAHELFALAVLEGINLAELNDERLDNIFKDQMEDFQKREFEQFIMGGGNTKEAKARAAAAIMSSNAKTPDGKPRFVTAAQLDPNTGKLIGEK